MRHRWKWISALLVAAALGFGWSFRQWPQPPAHLANPIAAAPVPAPFPSLWAARNPNAAVRDSSDGDHFDEIEVCGVGKVKFDRDDWTAAGKYIDALTKISRLRWLTTLLNSDDYRARATGLYVQGVFDRDAPQKEPEAARDELVQLAEETNDPVAFALAYAKCIKGVEEIASPRACPQLSLDDWTRADADNAFPWLQLASSARRNNDAAAEAAAMARASQAHRYDSYTWSLYSFAESAMPNDVTAADRWILTTQLIGVEAAMPAPYQPMFQYCSRDALGDPAVLQQCNAVAELMVNKATTLAELIMGTSLGGRVGWPKERVDKLTQEHKAALQAINQTTVSDPKQQWSCDNAARGNAYMSQWNELGERGAAGLAIERSGESVVELSRKFDEWVATLQRSAQESAQRQSAVPQP